MQCDSQAVWCRFWLFQCKMYAKYVNNKQREGRAINYDIKKQYQYNIQCIALTYVKFDDEDKIFACIFENYLIEENDPREYSWFVGRQNGKCIVIVENKYNVRYKGYGVGFGLCNAKCMQKA